MNFLNFKYQISYFALFSCCKSGWRSGWRSERRVCCSCKRTSCGRLSTLRATKWPPRSASQRYATNMRLRRRSSERGWRGRCCRIWRSYAGRSRSSTCRRSKTRSGSKPGQGSHQVRGPNRSGVTLGQGSQLVRGQNR